MFSSPSCSGFPATAWSTCIRHSSPSCAARTRWSYHANEVARMIRALDPEPGARTPQEPRGGRREALKGPRTAAGSVEAKVSGARVAEGHGPPGEDLKADSRLLIAAGS